MHIVFRSVEFFSVLFFCQLEASLSLSLSTSNRCICWKCGSAFAGFFSLGSFLINAMVVSDVVAGKTTTKNLLTNRCRFFLSQNFHAANNQQMVDDDQRWWRTPPSSSSHRKSHRKLSAVWMKFVHFFMIIWLLLFAASGCHVSLTFSANQNPSLCIAAMSSQLVSVCLLFGRLFFCFFFHSVVKSERNEWKKWEMLARTCIMIFIHINMYDDENRFRIGHSLSQRECVGSKAPFMPSRYR